MRTTVLPVGYVPLVDAAPLIVAHELGFDESEGLSLDLTPAPSWSSLRDMLAFGHVDAAHMLAPIPIAMALGLGGMATQFSALSLVSVNGTTIGVGRGLEERLRANGYGFDFQDAHAAGAALAEAIEGPIVIGVPFLFSMHAELLQYWLAGTPLASKELEIRTVPPQLMAQALAEGEVDAFCVGEPWGSVVVEQGLGALLLPGNAIWSFAPEKVLAVRSEWTETHAHLMEPLMRAIWRAGRWLNSRGSKTATADMLSRKRYLDVPSELIDRSLSGELVISTSGEHRKSKGFLEFFNGAVGFPWRSQAKWIGHQMARRHGLDTVEAEQKAGTVFRTDLYRRVLSPIGVDLPGASQKLEGAISVPTPVATARGSLILPQNQFFDGQVFEPSV